MPAVINIIMFVTLNIKPITTAQFDRFKHSENNVQQASLHFVLSKAPRKQLLKQMYKVSHVGEDKHV